MTSIYTPDERFLLDAWFHSAPIDDRIDALLNASGFADDCEFYTRLDAWVGAFAVAEIQARLPNFGVCYGDGTVVLTRKLRASRKRRVTGLVRHLFTINWADSGPGYSWPGAYNLVWIPEFDQFVLAYSTDSPELLGYCDFALGHFDAAVDWREASKAILVQDWHVAFEGFDQAPWAYLFDTGLVSSEEALAWRAEAWRGHEEIKEPKEELLEPSA